MNEDVETGRAAPSAATGAAARLERDALVKMLG
jgi:hypothetical protein